MCIMLLSLQEKVASLPPPTIDSSLYDCWKSVGSGELKMRPLLCDTEDRVVFFLNRSDSPPDDAYDPETCSSMTLYERKTRLIMC